ncbi:MAG: Thymidylate kinase [Planctomycetes bacterium ADurb.Bin401]|nr:MAG: Thymidylate kinase [Planctomycetes bacterium ADurb.Bin401]
MKKKLESKLIVLDGPDGCGKSSQRDLLAQFLTDNKVKLSCFRDPGSTATGEKIRDILLHSDHHISDRAELLLYMASRAQLWDECIAPALKKKHCVLLDRWVSSTCAYQGYAGGVGIKKVIDIAEHSLERVWPDLTIILDVDLKTAKKRMNRSLDRMEKKAQAYHKKVRAGFLKLAEMRKDIVVVDASRDIQTVHQQVVKVISSNLKFKI